MEIRQLSQLWHLDKCNIWHNTNIAEKKNFNEKISLTLHNRGLFRAPLFNTSFSVVQVIIKNNVLLTIILKF